MYPHEYLQRRDPIVWCRECGPDCCCEIQAENGLCAGAYEGICHAEWERLYGPLPKEHFATEEE